MRNIPCIREVYAGMKAFDMSFNHAMDRFYPFA
ncbi:hypothetical protein PLUA15_20157 [Pseudomonas lundensis]|uniref:Transposase n=1 Tax=Pseudomonas lundensis TaxID=86185 RepID=A0AAX2H516_9PSED|nr:hypothetical protein PLUA15_20157 [Pseudomonas lundensis]